MLLKFFQPIKEKPDLPHSVNRVEVANWYQINFSQGRTELNHDTVNTQDKVCQASYETKS